MGYIRIEYGSDCIYLESQFSSKIKSNEQIYKNPFRNSPKVEKEKSKFLKNTQLSEGFDTKHFSELHYNWKGFDPRGRIFRNRDRNMQLRDGISEFSGKIQRLDFLEDHEIKQRLQEESYWFAVIRKKKSPVLLPNWMQRS